MQKMTCVVIEDEPLSASILEDYIREVPFLDLKAVFPDAIAAADHLQHEPADLHFLDINLPRLKGPDMLRTFHFSGQFIITSAHHDHALEAYDLGVVDYLLKPVGFERFLKSVHKARALFRYQHAHKYDEWSMTTTQETGSVFFKSGTLIHKVDVDDITYFEKKGNYFELFTKTGKKILIRINFADLIEKLPARKFFRVHKSFIVSIRHIETIESNYIQVNKEKIPISLSFRDAFMKSI